MDTTMRWMADGPAQISPALASVGVEAYRVLYPHADLDSRDDDYRGLLVVDREDLHHLLGWPHASSIEEAMWAATEYAGEIERARRRYPQAKIALYGMPNPWLWITQAGAVVPLGEAAPETIDDCGRWYREALRPLRGAVDAIAVCCYEVVDDPGISREFWAARISLARRVVGWMVQGTLNEPPPVVAMVSPCRMASGVPSLLRPLDRWLALTVAAMGEAEPDIVAAWGAWDYWIGVAVSPPMSSAGLATTSAARHLLAQALTEHRLSAPPVDDHAGWAAVEPALRACVAQLVYVRLSAASLHASWPRTASSFAAPAPAGGAQ